ncbi:transposase [Streptomyces sp. XY66]|uniref:transposase n=1 Tax=Streptomyces sp. XY66 TaxID=1415563 RepID=UPI000D14BD73
MAEVPAAVCAASPGGRSARQCVDVLAPGVGGRLGRIGNRRLPVFPLPHQAPVGRLGVPGPRLKIRVPKLGSGRPRKKPDSVAADKAYSNGPCRDYLRVLGIRHTIPEKTDNRAARLRKGSRGGRPPGFDEERYRKRNTVERAINRLNQHRAGATRYDKRRYVYLGTATAAALTIWLRT